MFTGLIQALGRVASARAAGGGLRLGVDVSGLARFPEPGASVAVSGLCLTVTERRGHTAYFDVAAETVRRGTAGEWREGSLVNLEPALRVGDALDGHIVLGHVDTTSALLARRDMRGSEILRFSLPEPVAGWVAEKGSVALDGVSLTISALGEDWFEVSAIPETLTRTTLGKTRPSQRVNLEVDALARYATRWLSWTAKHPAASASAAASSDAGASLTEAMLRENGFF